MESLLIGFQRDSQAALGAVKVINSTSDGVKEVLQDDEEAAAEANRQIDWENSNNQFV